MPEVVGDGALHGGIGEFSEDVCVGWELFSELGELLAGEVPEDFGVGFGPVLEPGEGGVIEDTLEFYDVFEPVEAAIIELAGRLEG